MSLLLLAALLVFPPAFADEPDCSQSGHRLVIDLGDGPCEGGEGYLCAKQLGYEARWMLRARLDDPRAFVTLDAGCAPR